MACLVIVKRPSTHLRPGPRCMRHESAKLPQGFAPAASLRARLDADHLEPSGGRLGQAPRRHRRRHRAARSPAPPRARPHVRPAQLAHPPPRRARCLRSMMASMTRRAPPPSATISAVGATVVSPENTTRSLRSERATTHPLERPPYGRFCAVHVWPDLKCPPWMNAPGTPWTRCGVAGRQSLCGGSWWPRAKLRIR